MDNIRPINTTPNEMAGAVEAMKRQLSVWLDYAATVAEMKRAYFDELEIGRAHV